MTKQYLDENGVKKVWDTCKNTFAYYAGKTSFTITSLVDTFVIKNSTCYVLDEGNFIVVKANVVFQNQTDNVFTPSDYGFAVANVDVAMPTKRFSQIVDYHGIKLSEEGDVQNIPIASAVALTSSDLSMTYNTLQYGVNCILYRRGISANSINMGLINFGGLKVNPDAYLYVQAQVIIPLE